MNSACSICSTHRVEPGVELKGYRFWAYLWKGRCVLKEVAPTLSWGRGAGSTLQGCIYMD